METATANKRQVNGVNEEPALATKRVRTEKETAATAEEDEVEAFFAILQRMRHVARRYGPRGNGNGDGKGRWMPAFEWEDFEVAGIRDDGSGRNEVEEELAENRTGAVIDLNAKPEPEGSEGIALER